MVFPCFFFIYSFSCGASKDPPNIKGARTWGPSTYHQRERGALVEFPAPENSSDGQPSFSKSAPNLDKSKSPGPAASSSMSPLPPRMQRGGGGSASMHNRQLFEGSSSGSGNRGRTQLPAESLGKSHDEGLNRIKGMKKKLSTPQYYRGHTTNLCGLGSSSTLGTATTPTGSGPAAMTTAFKLMMSDSSGVGGGGLNPAGSLILRRVQEGSTGALSGSRSEKESLSCFGFKRGGGSGRGSGFSEGGKAIGTKSIENVVAAVTTSSPMADRRYKKFSLDNNAGATHQEQEPKEMTYDIAFYRKMQQSVDELFDERRFAGGEPSGNGGYRNMFNSKSSGDLVNNNSDDSESFAESNGSSEFKRECFFNRSAPEHETISAAAMTERKSSLTRVEDSRPGKGKAQYLSLNDLLSNNNSSGKGGRKASPEFYDRDEEEERDRQREEDRYDEEEAAQSVGSSSAQYSSSSSQTTTSVSSRKNSQVCFDERGGVGGSTSSSSLSGDKLIYTSERIPGFPVGRKVTVVEGGKEGKGMVVGKKKSPKAGFITNLFKRGHRSIEKRATAKRGTMGGGRDEKINLVADHEEEEEEDVEGVIVRERRTSTNRHAIESGVGNSSNPIDTYDMVYTKRHIIAKQNVSQQEHHRPVAFRRKEQ